MSSNSLELLLKMGMFDLLSPCLAGLGLVSGEMSFARKLLGGFIREILAGVLAGSSCSSVDLSPRLTVDRSPLLNLTASADGTSSSDPLPAAAAGFSRFVRSSIDARFLSLGSLAISLELSLASKSLSRDGVPSSSFAPPSNRSRYSGWRDGRLRYTRSSGDFLAVDQGVGGPSVGGKVVLLSAFNSSEGCSKDQQFIVYRRIRRRRDNYRLKFV